MFTAASKLYLIHQSSNQRIAAATCLLEHLCQQRCTAVDVVLDDGPIGEKLILGNFPLAVGMGDQCPNEHFILCDESRPLQLPTAEARIGCNLRSVLH